MISVCVPYWRRPEALLRLFSNYAQLYPTLEIEFSVCDDGSPEPAVVPRGVVLTRLPQKDLPMNPCVPINRAVAASHGDVVVLTNPEILHTTPVLPEMVAALTHPLDYVVAPCWDTRRKMWLAGPEVDYSTNGRLPVPPGSHFHFLAMFTRELWDLAGGFDEEYRNGTACDDNDWLWRAHAVGARFKTTTGVVQHDHLGTPSRWVLPHNGPLFRRKWPQVRIR